MYCKIALNNVKKSFKDYSIYFLTLTLAVCIFYSFNSIESQRAILELSKSESDSLDMLLKMISGVSIFVSVTLGCLIVYANNFLIKKRKKELGIYMSLGMGKQKISKILVFETFLVGFISLISGLIFGIILSQGLSVFTSNLFDVSMSEYEFIISFSAIGKTLFYFGIIFILAIILNTFVISRYKIIDLLTSSRKNENIKYKNPVIYVATFIISIMSIGIAYVLVKRVGLKVQDVRFVSSIILGIIGTLLFFFSLGGFGLSTIQRNKKVYFKDLNIFILRQINSKVNTNFLSMTIICLMLFLTIGILSTGLSFKDTLQSSVKSNTPFDATLKMYTSKKDKVQNIEQALKNINFKFDNSEEYIRYDEYHVEENISQSFEKYIKNKDNKDLSKYKDSYSHIVKKTEYNKVLKLNDEDEITLQQNEVLITSNNSSVYKTLNDILKYNNKILLNGKEYIIKNKRVITNSYRTSFIGDNLFSVIVNDELTNNIKVEASYINVKFNENNINASKSEEKFLRLDRDYKDRKINYAKGGFISVETKDKVYTENKGMTTTVLFIGIYLGIVFLISSMAILSLQQLSEASDSIERYKSLKRIGANDKMINKTIFIQTLIYFTLPLGVAFIHAIIGINVVNEFIKMYGNPDIQTSSFITALIFIIIYIGYFYATYTGYKNIIKNS